MDNSNASPSLEAQIEAVLFYSGEPTERDFLASSTGASRQDVDSAIETLSRRLVGTGLAVLEHGSTVALVTAKDCAQTIEKIRKDELSKDLGKAGLETLAIILYKGPVRRSEIEYIRGVNSSYVLRNLLVRGLVAKVEERGSRQITYQPTPELLAYLGITHISDMPEYDPLKRSIEDWLVKENKPEPSTAE